MKWQPIATAPKDGTHILLSWGRDDCTVGYYGYGQFNDSQTWIYADLLEYMICESQEGDWEPEYWLPMPIKPDIN